jgi:hypothetical protein
LFSCIADRFLIQKVSVAQFNWCPFLENWNTEALKVILLGLRKQGIADVEEQQNVALRDTASDVGVAIQEELFSPINESSDFEAVSEAQRRIAVIDALLLPRLAKKWPNLSDRWPGLTDEYEWAVLRNGGHFYPPVSEAAIIEKEHRLGLTLPPSYKNFLRCSNGWITWSLFLTSVDKIDWLKNRNPTWMEWDAERIKISDKDYFVYGKGQDPVKIRTEYLHRCIEISDPLQEVNCTFLLNPEVVFPDGEWEVWFLASWEAGARRF